MFKNKKLLITGGTESFGNKMLRFFIENTDIEECTCTFKFQEMKRSKTGCVPP